LEQANWRAAEATLRMIEKRFAVSRVGKAADGCQYVSIGLVVPMFEHSSSRAQDPDLHIHTQILNIGVDELGHSRAIDPLPIFENQLLFGAFYRAKLAAALRTEFGLVLEQEGTSFRILGVPRELVATYSKRRQQILEYLAERGEAVDQIICRKNHFTESELRLQTLYILPEYGLDPAPVFDHVATYLAKSPPSCLSARQAARNATQRSRFFGKSIACWRPSTVWQDGPATRYRTGV
jgi:hypothetical protein